MRAGEVARRAGVNVETLRYYERRGLLPEPARAPGGHRQYDEEAVRFVRAIKEVQAAGFTLAEIEEYLRAVRRGRVAAPEALRVRMAAKIDEIDARIAGLRRMRGELARIVGCACESLDHCTCGAAYLARRGRESPVRPSPLHVTNGESAGNTLRQTSLGGAVLPWQDVLHEGPVPAGARRELLTADQLETLWPARVPATPGVLSAAVTAWDAFRSPGPSALAACAAQDIPALPFLGPALRRLLEELPAPQDGLSGTERRALRAIASGAAKPIAAFRAAQDLEAAPFLGDTWFYRTLAILGAGESRLIETLAGEPLPSAPPLGDAHVFGALTLKLTRAGERVLQQKADRVKLLGVDRWVGGTHITASTAWRWDPAAQLLAEPA